MTEMIGATLGPYRIIREIGRGGMAIVYEAYQGNLARPVAIKVLLPYFSTNSTFVQRFLREARAAAALSHTNIVTIHDVVEQTGQYFIVMQLAPGMALDALLRQGGRLPLPRAQHILAQVAAALDHAHATGLVHRDIKPANIIIGPDDHAILTDFGLAKAAERDISLTTFGAVVGTPEYMSPEQAQGLTVDKASDIYSLGIVLYEMLTGQRPFAAPDTYALLYKQINESPPPIRSRAPDLSPKIQAVLDRALAKQPDQRFRSAGEMAAALSTIVTPRPVIAPSPPQPTPRPPRAETPPTGRLPILPIIGGIAALVIVVGGFIAFSGSLFGEAEPRVITVAAVPTPAIAPTVTQNAVIASQAATPTRPAAVGQTPQAVIVSDTTGISPTSTLLPIARPAQPAPARITPPVLLGPPDKEAVNDRTTFKWQAVELPPGAAYEVVWWRENASPDMAEGFASATLATTQEVDIAAYARLNGRLPANQPVRWTVIVVNKEPYKRLTLPSANSYRELAYMPATAWAPTVTPISAQSLPAGRSLSSPTPTRPAPAQPSPRNITAPAPLTPPDKETVSGRVTFRWQVVELPSGAAYEVVWWPKDANPDTALGFAPPTLETTQEVDIAAYASQGGLPTNQPVRWTVVVVNREPYKRLTLPSANSYQELSYSPSSGAGGGGGGIGKPK